MTAGEILNILEQFPREQLVEFGIVDAQQPDTVIPLDVAGVIISDQHLIMLDAESSRIIREVQSRALKGKPSEQGKERAL